MPLDSASAVHLAYMQNLVAVDNIVDLHTGTNAWPNLIGFAWRFSFVNCISFDECVVNLGARAHCAVFNFNPGRSDVSSRF